MVRKKKVAVSLSLQVLDLLGRHAAGRSRSQCVDEELLRALRAREWELLSSQTAPDDAAEQLAWAEASWETVDEDLSRQEHASSATEPRSRRRRAARS